MDLISAKDLAARLDVSPVTLQYWRRHDKGPAYVRVGKSIFYRPQDVEEWIVSQVVKPGTTPTNPESPA
jgi:DNA-binding transcriptional MerR regulator